jgi:hypothetical protein
MLPRLVGVVVDPFSLLTSKRISSSRSLTTNRSPTIRRDPAAMITVGVLLPLLRSVEVEIGLHVKSVKKWVMLPLVVLTVFNATFSARVTTEDTWISNLLLSRSHMVSRGLLHLTLLIPPGMLILGLPIISPMSSTSLL